MTFRIIRVLTMPERLDRSALWPVYIPRIYLAVRRAKPVGENAKGMSRLETWKFAMRWFHAWVWDYADLPWEQR